MTFREKLALEYPEKIDKSAYGGCIGCPYQYGYEPDIANNCSRASGCCIDCWDREMPETDKIEEKKEMDQNEYMEYCKEDVATTKKIYHRMKKAELLKELEETKAELERLEKYKKYEDSAAEMRAMFDAFEAQGFTREEIFKLLNLGLKG